MIHIVLGTRAQLIKMAPIMYELQQRNIDYNFVFVAQHRETIYEMLDQFQLKHPDLVIGETDKDIDKSINLFIWSVKTLLKMVFNKNKIYKGDHDGIVLVHGDALPLFFGAFSAKFQRLKVAQVEGGLRSYDFFNPFPEEIVRYVTSKLHLIDIFFCQDEQSMENASHYPGKKILTSGNTIKDSIKMPSKLNYQPPKDLVPEEPFVLVSLHRFENLSNTDRVDFIIEKLTKLSEKIKVMILLHPITRKTLEDRGDIERLSKLDNFELVPRQSFFDFNALFTRCEFIISDGGSNQEESSYLGIPCLLFRSETERAEGLGENVVLSKFDEKVIDDFFENYKNYRRTPDPKEKSPTLEIVEIVKDY